MAEHVCPWWLGYLLLNPLRRVIQNPRTILEPYINQEMVVLDVGCGMGYFSLDMATMVGPKGKVVCVDLQHQMIRSLTRRASKKGVLERLDIRVCQKESLCIEGLNGQIDFALAFAIVHEVPNPVLFLGQIHSALKPEARLLIVEPKGHISKKDFKETETAAQNAGFKIVGNPKVISSHAALLRSYSNS